ncbi:hypothetical protein F442_16695 [Phytophthora nicotianae P10297]|uniref:AP complex mu/sigma subunit domain-containing protein n=1 Tax=Phytophthora nicotianae P10297 TaxID=1317064 RepID=W2YK65_PHYNI|nr:hypothetical protein F442_16695 [Phytophthora nicotianae P10297]
MRFNLNFVDGKEVTTWKYSLHAETSKEIYANFVVQSYRPDVIQQVNANSFEYFVYGEFWALIYFVADYTSNYDDLIIEVVAATKEVAWEEMQHFIVSMELILKKSYPGFLWCCRA